MKARKAVLELFRKNPNSELSTSDIVKIVEKSKSQEVEEILTQKYSDPDIIKKAKRTKAQLHRKILYHLNELVKENILKLSKEGKKGEKFFSLDLEEGEEIVIEKYKKRSQIVISKPQSPAMPIEGYEQKGLVHKVEPATWIERLNSILVECSMFKNLKELLHFISNTFSNVNDTIALNDFEYLFENYEIGQIITFAHRLNNRCSDYGKRISCIFDLTNLKNEDTVIKFLKEYHTHKTKNLTFIFDVRVREFQEHSNFFERIVKIFSNSNNYFYIKNQDLHEAPYLLGRAGPYTFNEQEWKVYKQELQKHIKCLTCAHSTIMVDTHRFFEEESKDLEPFKHFTLKIANSLLSANSIQRRRSEEYFTHLVALNKDHVKDIFTFSKNYIRFWNYGFKRENFDQDHLIELFKKSKKSIDKFCISQETIYKSCGMPTRFRIALSLAFGDFVKEIFSEPKFKHLHISGIKDFYKEETKEILENKEKLFELFDGGDLLTFYRTGDLATKDILREISFILNTYKIHFFRWNFGNSKETNLSLGRFLK